jgi:hypothetical protein
MESGRTSSVGMEIMVSVLAHERQQLGRVAHVGAGL